MGNAVTQQTQETGKPRARATLGRKIKWLRISRGWSQEVLAELAGLHRNYVGAVERRELNIGVDRIERLAAALGVPVRALFEE